MYPFTLIQANIDYMLIYAVSSNTNFTSTH